MKVLFECSNIEYIAITDQVVEFCADLSDEEWLNLDVQAKVLAWAIESDAPLVVSVSKVPGSARLSEMEITPPDVDGPKAILLVVVEEHRVLVVHGVTVSNPPVPPAEIEFAETALTEFERESGGEPH